MEQKPKYDFKKRNVKLRHRTERRKPFRDSDIKARRNAENKEFDNRKPKVKKEKKQKSVDPEMEKKVNDEITEEFKVSLNTMTKAEMKALLLKLQRP